MKYKNLDFSLFLSSSPTYLQASFPTRSPQKVGPQPTASLAHRYHVQKTLGSMEEMRTGSTAAALEVHAWQDGQRSEHKPSCGLEPSRHPLVGK